VSADNNREATLPRLRSADLNATEILVKVFGVAGNRHALVLNSVRVEFLNTSVCSKVRAVNSHNASMSRKKCGLNGRVIEMFSGEAR
jgi:ribosomal protein L40E